MSSPSTKAQNQEAQNQELDVIDRDAYFQRIGYSGDRAATLETLTALQYHHTQTIAFENLNPLLAWPVHLDLRSLQQKIIQSGRGGYCFEQNLLFRAVLQSLGFDVSCLAAQVLWGMPEGSITPRNHMALLVRLDGDAYLVDVGFGGITLTTPLRLVPDIEQATSHESFRLMLRDGLYHLQVFIAQTWQPLYQFDLQEQPLPDYKVRNWYVSTHPQSLFVNTLMVARPDADRRYALRDNQFTIHYLDGRTERHTLTTATDLVAVLTHEFRLTVPTDPKLHQVLQRLIQ